MDLNSSGCQNLNTAFIITPKLQTRREIQHCNLMIGRCFNCEIKAPYLQLGRYEDAEPDIQQVENSLDEGDASRNTRGGKDESKTTAQVAITLETTNGV